ncbi:hypothetical protein [Anaerosolibacter sp.]|uniref:hypothetical protein n=1 Tax=Anaerosolibacter sp. TaxID=1872527 RepID=UPI0039EE930F
MLLKWFSGGAVLGFIAGIFVGAGFQGAIFCALLVGFITVKLRKWLLRTFWM